ncbi:MAG: hypothetical protein RL308_1096 [Bacteroidota bacterium]|jgi:hypothetical protein
MSRLKFNKNIKKASFISELIDEVEYPITMLELAVTIGELDLINKWDKLDTFLIDNLTFSTIDLFSNKQLGQFKFVVRVLESYSDNTSETLFSIKFLFVGEIEMDFADKIYNQFNNMISENFGGNPSVKLKHLDKLSFILEMTPINLIYTPLKKENQFYSKEFLNMLVNNPIMVFPKLYLKNTMHIEDLLIPLRP